MNILLLAPHPFYQHRGTPIAVRLISKVLGEHHHKITLLTFPEGKDILYPNLEIIRIPKIPGMVDVRPGLSIKKIIYDVILGMRAILLVKRKKIDIVHAVEESIFIAIFIKWIYGIPFIYDMDSSLPQQIVEKYPFSKWLLPVLQLFERWGIKESLGVLPVCALLEKIVSGYDAQKPCQRLEDISLKSVIDMKKAVPSVSIPNGNKVIMYVGNLLKYQGIDLLIQSFQKVHQIFPESVLVIIGGNSSDIEMYEEKVRGLDLSESVRFLGPYPLNCLFDFLKQADILVSPRITGINTPMKIYSYLDSGKPLVATRIKSHTQVIGETIACLVKPCPEKMADGIIRLLKNKKLMKRLAKNAQIRVQNEYTYEAYERKLMLFYNKINMESEQQ